MTARYRVPAPHMPWAESITTRGAPFSERAVASYHEAGHAFVAAWEGVPVKEVYVTDHGEGGCSCEPPPNTMDAVELVKSQLRIAFAGQEAARFVDPHGLPHCCRSDRDFIAEIVGSIAALTGDENSTWDFADTERQEAARIVDKFWPFVEKIARALNKRGTLSGDEVRRILGLPPRSSGSNKEPATPAAPEPSVADLWYRRRTLANAKP